MRRVKRIPLTGIEITGSHPAFRKHIPNGTLVLTQDLIDDGFGGTLPGMREWKLETSYEAMIPFSGETVDMVSGSFAGRCFVLSISGESMTFQGTGELKGI